MQKPNPSLKNIPYRTLESPGAHLHFGGLPEWMTSSKETNKCLPMETYPSKSLKLFYDICSDSVEFWSEDMVVTDEIQYFSLQSKSEVLDCLPGFSCLDSGSWDENQWGPIKCMNKDGHHRFCFLTISSDRVNILYFVFIGFIVFLYSSLVCFSVIPLNISSYRQTRKLHQTLGATFLICKAGAMWAPPPGMRSPSVYDWRGWPVN